MTLQPLLITIKKSVFGTLSSLQPNLLIPKYIYQQNSGKSPFSLGSTLPLWMSDYLIFPAALLAKNPFQKVVIESTFSWLALELKYGYSCSDNLCNRPRATLPKIKGYLNGDSGQLCDVKLSSDSCQSQLHTAATLRDFICRLQACMTSSNVKKHLCQRVRSNYLIDTCHIWLVTSWQLSIKWCDVKEANGREGS